MAISITGPETERLARELAAKRGTSVDEAVRKAAARSRPEGEPDDLVEQILAIARRCASLPRLTNRTPDEIIGYDEYGVPR